MDFIDQVRMVLVAQPLTHRVRFIAWVVPMLLRFAMGEAFDVTTDPVGRNLGLVIHVPAAPGCGSGKGQAGAAGRAARARAQDSDPEPDAEPAAAGARSNADADAALRASASAGCCKGSGSGKGSGKGKGHRGGPHEQPARPY